MYSDEAFPLVRDVEQFDPCRSARSYVTGTSLRKQLEFIVHKQVTWLDENRQIDSVINVTQCRSLVGAAQNVRLQARITYLTWALRTSGGRYAGGERARLLDARRNN